MCAYYTCFFSLFMPEHHHVFIHLCCYFQIFSTKETWKKVKGGRKFFPRWTIWSPLHTRKWSTYKVNPIKFWWRRRKLKDDFPTLQTRELSESLSTIFFVEILNLSASRTSTLYVRAHSQPFRACHLFLLLLLITNSSDLLLLEIDFGKANEFELAVAACYT